MSNTTSPEAAMAPVPSWVLDAPRYMRDWFPDPNRPVWEQFFSDRHRQSYEERSHQRQDTEVFPFFDRTNFSRLHQVDALKQPSATWFDPAAAIPEIWYARFLPVLVLATRLTGSGCMPEMNRATGYDLEAGADLEAKFEAMTRGISNAQFFTGHSFDAIHPGEDAYVSDGLDASEQSGRKVASPSVQLNPRWMTAFSRTDYDELPEDVKNRLLVSLAIVFVHELAHLWWSYRLLEFARVGDVLKYHVLRQSRHSGEPYRFGDEAIPELGWAWERYAFKYGFGMTPEGPYEYSRHLIGYRLEWSAETSTSLVHANLKRPELVCLIDPCLVGALLDETSWEIYEGLKAESTRPELANNILLFHRMAKVVAVRTQLYDRTLMVWRYEEDFLEEAELLAAHLNRDFSPRPPPTRPSAPSPDLELESRMAEAADGRQTFRETLIMQDGKIVRVISRHG